MLQTQTAKGKYDVAGKTAQKCKGSRKGEGRLNHHIRLPIKTQVPGWGYSRPSAANSLPPSTSPPTPLLSFPTLTPSFPFSHTTNPPYG